MARKTTTTVDPLGGLAPWVGGKRHLARRICDRIEATPHRCFAEPFVGMGGVFLRRRHRAKSEAINDFHGEVSNLFRIVQRHPEALWSELGLWTASKADYDRLRHADPAGLTDIERAARLLFLQAAGFGGKVSSHVYGRRADGKAGFSSSRCRHLIQVIHRRLEGVHIDGLPYQEFIGRWDRPDTLFYLDPPYWGSERVYGPGLFERADFERLATVLRAIKGRFILSLNDVPEIRAMFAWARIEEEPTTYGLGHGKRVTELVISSPRRR